MFYRDDHLKSYYQPRSPEADHDGPALEFVVELGCPVQLPQAPIVEAKRCAMEIAKAYGKEIYVCMSGGVDSEAVALAFLHAKVPFRAAVLRFNDGLNRFDIKYAYSFCQAHGIEVSTFDVAIDDFYFSGECFEWAKDYGTTSPQVALHLKLLGQIPGVPVLSWNPLRIFGDLALGPGPLFGVPADMYFSYQRYFERQNRPGIPFFFLYSPELAYSFLRLPLSQAQLTNSREFRERFSQDHYLIKLETYRSGGFAMKMRPDKFTGFEVYKEELARRLGGGEGTFNRLFREPLKPNLPEAKIHAKLSPEFYLLELGRARQLS